MSEWIDLSVLIDKNYIGYPGDDPIKCDKTKDSKRDNFTLIKVTTDMHKGTHLDAPMHMFSAGKSVEQININKVMGIGTVIRPKIKNGIIQTNDIKAKYIYKNRILLLSLDHEKYLNTKAYYEQPKFETSILDFLLENKINVIGFDLPSPEYYSGDSLAMHRDLLSNKILIYENLCNLDKLEENFEFIGLPLKIKGLEASLCRCVARNIKII